MISAVVVPFDPSASTTAKAPETNAPDEWERTRHERHDGDRPRQRHAEGPRADADDDRVERRDDRRAEEVLADGVHDAPGDRVRHEGGTARWPLNQPAASARP
jgi:hypothetical protein